MSKSKKWENKDTLDCLDFVMTVQKNMGECHWLKAATCGLKPKFI